MPTHSLIEVTEAVTTAVADNRGEPTALLPQHETDELLIGTVVWRRHEDSRPITHTYIFNKESGSAFLEGGDYHLSPLLDTFDATRQAALRAFPDLARAAKLAGETDDPREMLPHILATRLMAGDPVTYKQGYSEENAIRAVVDLQGLAPEEEAALRHNLAEAVLSVYRITRIYGGPEEGGWWDDHYDHVATLTKPVPFWQLAEIIKQLEQKDPKRFNTNGRPDLRLLIEDAPRALQTTEAPRYE